jgi:hypothetical protein
MFGGFFLVGFLSASILLRLGLQFAKGSGFSAGSLLLSFFLPLLGTGDKGDLVIGVRDLAVGSVALVNLCLHLSEIIAAIVIMQAFPAKQGWSQVSLDFVLQFIVAPGGIALAFLLLLLFVTAQMMRSADNGRGLAAVKLAPAQSKRERVRVEHITPLDSNNNAAIQIQFADIDAEMDAGGLSSSKSEAESTAGRLLAVLEGGGAVDMRLEGREREPDRQQAARCHWGGELALPVASLSPDLATGLGELTMAEEHELEAKAQEWVLLRERMLDEASARKERAMQDSGKERGRREEEDREQRAEEEERAWERKEEERQRRAELSTSLAPTASDPYAHTDQTRRGGRRIQERERVLEVGKQARKDGSQHDGVHMTTEEGLEGGGCSMRDSTRDSMRDMGPDYEKMNCEMRGVMEGRGLERSASGRRISKTKEERRLEMVWRMHDEVLREAQLLGKACFDCGCLHRDERGSYVQTNHLYADTADQFAGMDLTTRQQRYCELCFRLEYGLDWRAHVSSFRWNADTKQYEPGHGPPPLPALHPSSGSEVSPASIASIGASIGATSMAPVRYSEVNSAFGIPAHRQGAMSRRPRAELREPWDSVTLTIAAEAAPPPASQSNRPANKAHDKAPSVVCG